MAISRNIDKNDDKEGVKKTQTPTRKAVKATKKVAKKRRKTSKKKKAATRAVKAVAKELIAGTSSPPSTSDTQEASVSVEKSAVAQESQTAEAEAEKAPIARRTRRRTPRGRRRLVSDVDAVDSIPAHLIPADDEEKPTRQAPRRRRSATPSPTPADPSSGRTTTSPSDSPDSKPEAESAGEPSSDSLAQDPAQPKRRTRRRGGRRRRAAGAHSADGNGETDRTEAASEDEASATAVAVSTTADSEPEMGEVADAADKIGSREMLINVSTGEECRIAVLQEGRLEELFIERESAASHVGNIYKGRVTNVESSIQAVFVDFGLPRNGFLHISDVHTRYFPDSKTESEDVGRKISRRDRPPIQNCLRRGQEVIVQITKEGVGTKGPTLTTYLSIPGRYIVLMPGMSKLGVSRRIEDEESRRTMKSLLKELTLPEDMGFILRTAGLDQPKRELQRDLNYLTRLWKTLTDRQKKLPSPVELYQESDLVTRTIRDIYTSDFRRIVVDDEATLEKVQEFLHIAMPRTRSSVELYDGNMPLFHSFGIEEEIARLNSRHVMLPSGGSLVIDSHEAMVTIDVNSGRFRTPDNAEETAVKIDLEAAEEIARQLRLRDLGGLIVCDFIDVRLPSNARKIVHALKTALKKHKERVRVLNMSPFGLVEITRQRQRPSILRNIYADCPHCAGRGLVKKPESMSLDVARFIQFAAYRDDVQEIRITVSYEVAHEVLNRKRADIHRIELETGKSIVISGSKEYQGDAIDVECLDGRGGRIDLPVFGDDSSNARFGPGSGNRRPSSSRGGRSSSKRGRR